MGEWTYVTTSEVSTLEHELRDHTVELAARVAEALLAGAESAEVLGGLGDDIVEELEVDAAGASCRLSSAIGFQSIGVFTHTLVGHVLVGDLAAGITLELRAGPGAVELVSGSAAEGIPPRTRVLLSGRALT